MKWAALAAAAWIVVALTWWVGELRIRRATRWTEHVDDALDVIGPEDDPDWGQR